MERIDTLALILQGRYDAEGRLDENDTGRRLVTVDLSDESQWGDIGWFTTPDGAEHRGLGNEVDGWWEIVEIFDLVEPEVELLGEKYPVGYEISGEGLSKIIEETRPTRP